MGLIPTRRGGVFVALVVCAALFAALAPASIAGPEGRRSVILQAGSEQEAAALVTAVGGVVTYRLPIVSGVAAELPAAAAARLARRPGVAVTPNAPVRMAESTTPLLSNDSTLNHVVHREVNADRLWAEGIRGDGVTVAIVDTGVAEVPALAGRVVPIANRDHLRGTAPTTDAGGVARCVDFSATGTCADQFGHGTFVGGLVAGAGEYPGLAPAARLLSVKIAGPDGSADVSKVLAAIQWVVSFKDDYGVKVPNLSLGTYSAQGNRHYRYDPLNHAVQRAWLSGITVVVSAGNMGRRTATTATISKPADDPLVITVGAVDDRQTPAIDDDRSPLFSSTGPASYRGSAETVAKPDVVAPGARIVSLRAPGSTIDAIPATSQHPRYRQGSGTSMSAGVVSGIAALLLDAKEHWAPDHVKWAMRTTARKVAERDRTVVGAGLVDAWAARAASPPADLPRSSLLATQPSTLAESRGDVVVTRECSSTEAGLAGLLGQQCNETVDGEETAQNAMWDADNFYDDDNWDGSSWYETQWAQESLLQGSSWYETAWAEGSSWYGSSWYGSSWYGSVEAATFYGVAVQGSSWYGAWG